MMLMKRIKETQIKKRPEGLFLISPWIDFGVDSQPSYIENQLKDESNRREKMDYYKSQIKGEVQSVLEYGDEYFIGLPKSFIVVGGNEILLDDSKKLYEKMMIGNNTRLEVYQGLYHSFPLYHNFDERSKRGFHDLIEFIKEIFI
jgi:acetyl esterase/lipase